MDFQKIMPETRPKVTVHFSSDAPDLRPRAAQAARLEPLANRVLPRVLDHPGPHPPVLPTLEEVEIHLVDDPTIADLHAQFMNDPSPTDIITFQHGEIFISLQTAARQAAEFEQEPDRELERYVIHGLLHLNGHEDLDPVEREAMHTAQEAILQEIPGLA